MEGASKYLNNLLLARGLLQNGNPIDFTHQEQQSEVDATTAKIINLIHELVLRRDREVEQHEAMAAAIRKLREDDSQRLLDFQRLQDKNAQLRSEINTLLTQERTLQSTIKKADVQMRDLREQTAKLKSTVDQVRAKCISDVRKKDIEIEKLKGHIASFQRGRREASGMKINTINCQPGLSGARERRNGNDVNSAEWNLNDETNDFLAALVNETSGENVALRQIVEDTIKTLRDLTGLDVELAEPEENGIGIPGLYRKSRQAADDLISCQILAQQMAFAIEHCRTILKDPSFVPIEEVTIRDEEIAKLKSGWEKMADRWKEAITMMGQWKQRMMDEGRSMDMGEFSDLSFGRSVAVRPDGQPVLGHDHELSSIYEQELDGRSETSSSPSPPSPRLVEDYESELELEPEPEPEPEPAAKRLASSPAKRGLRLQKPAGPLSETDGNQSKKTTGNQQKLNDHPRIFEGGAVVKNDISAGFKKPVTVSEKLAAVEAEAAATEAERKDAVSHKRKAPIRNTDLRKTSRRRSTLTPEELAALMKAR